MICMHPTSGLSWFPETIEHNQTKSNQIDPWMTQVHAKAGSEEENKHPHGRCQCHLLCLLVPDQLEDDDANADNDDNDYSLY